MARLLIGPARRMLEQAFPPWSDIDGELSAQLFAAHRQVELLGHVDLEPCGEGGMLSGLLQI